MTKALNTVVTLLAVVAIVAPLEGAAVAARPEHRQPEWCRNQRLGWHFYCDEPKQEKTARPATAAPDKSALEQVQDLQKIVDEARARAVLKPTPENVKQYLVLNQKMLDMASTFADQWQRVAWANPELDYTLQRPVSTLGKETWKNTRNAEKATVLANLNQRFGVFFVYLSTCPYCHAYSPVLKDFATRYGIAVQPISLDGGVLPEWPESVRDSGQWSAWGLSSQPVPATLLYDRKAKQIIPVAFGLLSADELEERIYLTTTKEVGDDF